MGMISLALKLAVPGEGNANETEWHDVVGTGLRCTLPERLRYAARLMERAQRRDMEIASFYITESARRVSGRSAGCSLCPEILRAMAGHGADFSYGAFSSYYESSYYAISSFYVLRFRKNMQQQLARLITEKMLPHSFRVWMEDFQGTPYILFDAHENGVDFLISQLATLPLRTSIPPTLRLDYFSNSPWCWVDLESEAISALAELGATLRLSIHRKMHRPRQGRLANFWSHVFRTARQHLSTR